jgi:hypothetical protein
MRHSRWANICIGVDKVDPWFCPASMEFGDEKNSVIVVLSVLVQCVESMYMPCTPMFPAIESFLD